MFDCHGNILFPPGYPVVQLTGATSDILSETDKTSDNTVIKENSSNTNSEVSDAVITEDSCLVIGSTQRMKVTHVESPREVYFLKNTDKESFSKFHRQLAGEAERMEGRADLSPAVGSLVLVRASDNNWYRGEVLSGGDSWHLLFHAVDFGFTEKVRRKDVRDNLSSQLKSRPYFGKIV